jgi:hypothetical protein
MKQHLILGIERNVSELRLPVEEWEADSSQVWKPHALCGLSLGTYPFPLRTKSFTLMGN